ncbi:MAG: hypothetical protein R3F55_24670 [Alphaproteobacteria bacterium]
MTGRPGPVDNPGKPRLGEEMSDHALLAAELAALCDTMLPGDARFPCATDVGAQGVAADRLRMLVGQDGLDRIVAALAIGGGPLVGAADRNAVVAAFERAEPALFAAVRMALFTAYYESPAVVRAVRALGHDYNDAPQPRGYVMPAFDPADPLNAPPHRRGHFVATEAVQRVDLSKLPADPLAPEDHTAAVGKATGRGLLSIGTREGGR